MRLQEGVVAWNAWRERDYASPPQLEGIVLPRADLRGADLANADLANANLANANLAEADLADANLADANLAGAVLTRAVLTGAALARAVLTQAQLSHANLHGAGLRGAKLTSADLTFADLSGADLSHADVSGANVHSANLTNASLSFASLSFADLSHADLTNAGLLEARLQATRVDGTRLNETRLGNTVFADIDLSAAVGLAACDHSGPSSLDYRTLERSGNIPLPFLRGCGLSDKFITYIPSIFSGDAIQFYSCFLSHSSRDKAFVDRLYADLQNKGVRTWYAPEDLKTGDRMLDTFLDAIRVHDKLLIVLSESSIDSEWVEREVKAALAREARTGETTLFPIRLDDAVMDSKKAWAALIRDDRHISDFTAWATSHDAYQQAFKRLLRDLGRSPPAAEV